MCADNEISRIAATEPARGIRIKIRIKIRIRMAEVHGKLLSAIGYSGGIGDFRENRAVGGSAMKAVIGRRESLRYMRVRLSQFHDRPLYDFAAATEP
jgi:hypothetical protein